MDVDEWSPKANSLYNALLLCVWKRGRDVSERVQGFLVGELSKRVPTNLDWSKEGSASLDAVVAAVPVRMHCMRSNHVVCVREHAPCCIVVSLVDVTLAFEHGFRVRMYNDEITHEYSRKLQLGLLLCA